MPVVALVFVICGTTWACEEGVVLARDCGHAEAWLRAGLRSDQTLQVLDCRPHDGRWPGGD